MRQLTKELTITKPNRQGFLPSQEYNFDPYFIYHPVKLAINQKNSR